MERQICDLKLTDNRVFNFYKLAVPEELGLIKDLIYKLDDQDLLAIGIDKEDKNTVENFIRNIRDRHYSCIIAKINDTLVGFTVLKLPEYGWMRKVAEIQGIVLPEYRRLGIAKKLLNCNFQASLTENLQSLIVKTIDDDPDTIATFELLGFKKHSVMKGMAYDIVERKKDLIIYALDVNEFWNNVLYGKQFGRSMED